MFNYLQKLLVCILASSFILLANAFEGCYANDFFERAEHKSGAWPQFELHAPLYKDKVYADFYFTPIFVNSFEEVSPIILRPSLRYKFNKHWAYAIAYEKRWQWDESFEPTEDIFWQQVVFKHSLADLFPNFNEEQLDELNRLQISHRLRTDMRNHKDLGLSFRVRFRNKGRYYLGTKRDWFLVANNECFFYLNSRPGRDNGFAEDRVFAGLGKRFMNKKAYWEVGYQLRAINRGANQIDRFNHDIMSTVSFTLPNLIK